MGIIRRRADSSRNSARIRTRLVPSARSSFSRRDQSRRKGAVCERPEGERQIRTFPHRVRSPADEKPGARQREGPRAVHFGQHADSPPGAHTGTEGRVDVGSTAGPLTAVLVPNRMEARTDGRHTTGTATPAWMAQTPASWLTYAYGSTRQTSTVTPAKPPRNASSSVAKRIAPPTTLPSSAAPFAGPTTRSDSNRTERVMPIRLRRSPTREDRSERRAEAALAAPGW